MQWQPSLSNDGKVVDFGRYVGDGYDESVIDVWSQSGLSTVQYHNPNIATYPHISNNSSTVRISRTGDILGGSWGEGYRTESPGGYLLYSCGLIWLAGGGGATVVGDLLLTQGDENGSSQVGGDTYFLARDVNEIGFVVGEANEGGVWHPALWYEGATEKLSTDSTGSLALSINNSDPQMVVGTALNKPVLWTKRDQSDETWIQKDLGPWDPIQKKRTPLPSGAPKRVNDRCEIIGDFWDSKSNFYQFWQNGRPVDLNTRISNNSGYLIAEALDINNKGAILATATRQSDGDEVSVLLLPVDIRFMKPDVETWNDSDELPDGRVVLFEENLRIRIKVPMHFDNLAKMTDIPELSQITFKTLDLPNGITVNLQDLNGTFSNDANSSELTAELSRSRLKTWGVLPVSKQTGVESEAWYDVGAPPPSSLADSLAFEESLDCESRGRCSPSPQNGTLDSDPPNSPIDKTFIQAGGSQIISAEIGGAKSKRKQIADQADYFYYSGHGQSDGTLTPGGESVGPSEVEWSNGMNVAIFAGCSVLRINDYNGDATFSPAPGQPFPGVLWQQTGPTYLLGYEGVAPSDGQGSDSIVRYWAANKGTQGNAMAWMNANSDENQHHACAIQKATMYYYFKQIKVFGVPVHYSIAQVPASDW
jgi:hypothetical protein